MFLFIFSSTVLASTFVYLNTSHVLIYHITRPESGRGVNLNTSHVLIYPGCLVLNEIHA